MTYIPCPHTPACHALTYCAHTETFVAGWNMPGCLPDTAEPLPEFDNTVEAWEYLIDEINLCASEMPMAGSTSSPLEDEIRDFDTSTIDQTHEGGFELGGLYYFVQRVESGQ